MNDLERTAAVMEPLLKSGWVRQLAFPDPPIATWARVCATQGYLTPAGTWRYCELSVAPMVNSLRHLIARSLHAVYRGVLDDPREWRNLQKQRTEAYLRDADDLVARMTEDGLTIVERPPTHAGVSAARLDALIDADTLSEIMSISSASDARCVQCGHENGWHYDAVNARDESERATGCLACIGGKFCTCLVFTGSASRQTPATPTIGGG